MAHCEGVLLMEKTLLIFLFGLPAWFCPHSCWCSNLTGLDLRGKKANQMSNFLNVTSANLAIDGNSHWDWQTVTCCSTDNKAHPWWKVDMGTNRCLGRITLVNRGDCCNERLIGATVRVGIDGDLFNNAACGLPVTSDQASVPGAHIPIMCDPPVIARYVSVDIARNEYLTLCEVIVEEYPMEDCPTTTTSGMSTATRILGPFATTCMSALIFEGYVIDPRPLSVAFINSPTQCFVSCKMNNECWSFDYVLASGQCRHYDAKVGDLKIDNQPGCLVYEVVRG